MQQDLVLSLRGVTHVHFTGCIDSRTQKATKTQLYVRASSLPYKSIWCALDLCVAAAATHHFLSLAWMLPPPLQPHAAAEKVFSLDVTLSCQGFCHTDSYSTE